MTPGAIGLRSERGPILLALMVSMALIALDSTILATVIPSIVEDLGGFASFPWLFSIYLLTQAVTVPVYAKLSDRLGRKPVLLAGIAIFLAGSILGGAAWSMPALIAARAVQGLGAGAIHPTVTTVAGDIYTVAERARVQGYLNSVWATSAVLGPALGGGFAQFVSWRWVFFINIPVCLIAMAMLWIRYHESPLPEPQGRIDYAGAALITAGLSLLILGLLEGGQAWAWGSPASIASFALGGACLAGFIAVERRSPEPVLPLWVFSDRLLLPTILVYLGVGAVVIGLSSYVPTFLEQAGGAVPLVAGFAVAATSIGWPIASGLSGRMYLRVGFRLTAVAGTALMVAGSVLLLTTTPLASPALTASACLVTGAGLGLASTPTIVAAQSSVSYDQRGVVTGVNMLARAAGSAVGVAVFGAIANAMLARDPAPQSPGAMITSAGGVFTAVLLCALLTVVAAAMIPRRVTLVEGA